MRCHYNTIKFLQNIHKRHPIPCLLEWGMGCLLWGDRVTEWYSVSVPAMICAISCFIGLCSGLALDILKMESWMHMGRTAIIIIKDIIHILRPSAKICVLCWWDGVTASTGIITAIDCILHSGENWQHHNKTSFVPFLFIQSPQMIYVKIEVSSLFSLWSYIMFVQVYEYGICYTFMNIMKSCMVDVMMQLWISLFVIFMIYPGIVLISSSYVL